ncbi:MAG: hypothetical protein ABIO70_22555, partial [Pseudomonadota bacterium]
MLRPLPDPASSSFGGSAEGDDRHDAFVDETLAVWQPLTKEPLTRSDARQIARDMGDFLAVLADWHRMEREQGAPAEPA